MHVAGLGLLSCVCWLFVDELPTAPLAFGSAACVAMPATEARAAVDLSMDEARSDAECPIDHARDVQVSDIDDEDTPPPRIDVVSASASDASIGLFSPFHRRAQVFGNRCQRGRHQAVLSGGASDSSEAAVEAALRWFKRHQGRDGCWDADCYQDCSGAGTKTASDRVPIDREEQTVAFTGLALLCFLGAGYDHRMSGPYRATVQHGVSALVGSQDSRGSFSIRNYGHSIATMTLAEAYAMSRDQELEGPLRRAVAVILERQNCCDGDSRRGGWDYQDGSGREDTSVTGWNVMALASARAAGIAVEEGLAGSRRWLGLAWARTRSGCGFPYVVTAEGQLMSCAGSLDGVAVTCAYLLGSPDARMVGTLAASIAKRQPDGAFSGNFYGLYYDTTAMFGVGGSRWTVWNHAVREMLVTTQRPGSGCNGGSWGGNYGRVFATAMGCLTLEIAYRHLCTVPGG